MLTIWQSDNEDSGAASRSAGEDGDADQAYEEYSYDDGTYETVAATAVVKKKVNGHTGLLTTERIYFWKKKFFMHIFHLPALMEVVQTLEGWLNLDDFFCIMFWGTGILLLFLLFFSGDGERKKNAERMRKPKCSFVLDSCLLIIWFCGVTNFSYFFRVE